MKDPNSGDDGIVTWVHRLCGFEPERVRRGLERVDAWGISHVQAQLLDQVTVENALAATLLAESVEYLATLGVPEKRLLKKLRGDRDLWSTYAEIRAAKLLAAPFRDDAAFEIEPMRSNGRHADFKLRVLYEAEPVFVEFKAIGLSDDEAKFAKRMGPQLESLLPPYGYCAFHGRLDSQPFVIRPEARDRVDASAAECASRVRDFPSGLASVDVVAHNSEPGYLRRLILRLVTEAALQIPEGDRGWVAFFWTNGVAVRQAMDELRWDEVPECIAGIIFVGDVVAFPSPNVHSYYIPVPRGMPNDARSELLSNLSSGTGATVLSAVETSSGVRAQLVADRSHGAIRELIRRDGSRRIAPFLFLMDRDRGDFQTRHHAPIHRDTADEKDLFPR